MTKKNLKAFGTRLGVSNLTVYISRHASNDTKKMETGLHQHLPSVHVTLAVIENGNTIKACTK